MPAGRDVGDEFMMNLYECAARGVTNIGQNIKARGAIKTYPRVDHFLSGSPGARKNFSGWLADFGRARSGPKSLTFELDDFLKSPSSTYNSESSVWMRNARIPRARRSWCEQASTGFSRGLE